MDKLPVEDVAQLVRLLAEVGDPTDDGTVPERKRRLIEGLAKIVDADVWMWNTGVVNHCDTPDDVMATSIIDGGWQNDEERITLFGLLTDPNLVTLMQGGALQKFVEQKVCTIGPDEVVDPTRKEEALAKWQQCTGLGDGLVACYPVGPHAFSAIGLHRRRGRPMFGDRERTIVQLVIEQVDWLHRHGSKVPAQSKVLNLSARPRQVLIQLLAGDNQRQIAQKMRLSEHTVNHYVKQIYKQFAVNSRGELFAHFATGGRV